MKQQIKIDMNGSYKLGMDEVIGLEAAMREVLAPVIEQLNELDSWSGDGWFKAEPVEYKRCDGFIPHAHNCGGLEVRTIIPKCGEYDFSFLAFGEYEERPEGMSDEDYEDQRNSEESEGHLDAGFRLWFKFEGIENGVLKFYLYMGGGNGDAPYFRSKGESDLFEASFECKSLAGLKRAARKHINALMKVMA